jgi:hypothetical protein
VTEDLEVPEGTIKIITKRSEMVFGPPKGFLAWDEIRFRRCEACGENWADDPSPLCLGCMSQQVR